MILFLGAISLASRIRAQRAKRGYLPVLIPSPVLILSRSASESKPGTVLNQGDGPDWVGIRGANYHESKPGGWRLRIEWGRECLALEEFVSNRYRICRSFFFKIKGIKPFLLAKRTS